MEDVIEDSFIHYDESIHCKIYQMVGFCTHHQCVFSDKTTHHKICVELTYNEDLGKFKCEKTNCYTGCKYSFSK